jgi:hypothetical protein
VKLFFDEDVGRGVPEALRAIDACDTVSYVRLAFRSQIQAGRFPDGVKDEDWIPFAGRGGWLVVSCNVRILDAEAQRNLWITEGVGGVFLTSGHEKKLDVLRLMLRKLDWLEAIDREVARPFAYLLPMRGSARRDLRVP